MLADECGLIFYKIFASKILGIEFDGDKNKNDWINEAVSIAGGYKFFLIEIEQMDCEAHTRKSGFEFICTKNLSSCWLKYRNKDIEKSLMTLGNDNDSDPDVLNSWKDLSFISLSPTNSIILVDRYIFSDSWNQKIDDNLYPLLETIIPIEICSSLDILIIAEDISIELHQKINTHFAKFQEKIKINFYFLKWSYSFMENKTLHDRYIYTNYYTIISGPGFNIFNNGRLKESNGLFSVKFTFAGLSMKIYQYHLELLRSYSKNCRKKKIFKTVDNKVIRLLNHYPDTLHCTMLN